MSNANTNNMDFKRIIKTAIGLMLIVFIMVGCGEGDSSWADYFSQTIDNLTVLELVIIVLIAGNLL